MKFRRFAIAAALVVTAIVVAGGAVSHRRAQARNADAVDGAPSGPLRRPIPTPAPGKAIRELAAGDEQTCALYTDGTVVCWGADRRGSTLLGSPDADADADAILPRRIEGTGNAVAIAIGDSHGCVLDAEGLLSCWGYCDLACRAGNGPLLFSKATRVAMVPRLAAMAVDTLGGATCGVGAEDEELHCWAAASATVSWFGDPVSPRFYHYDARDLASARGRFEPHACAGAVELMSATTGVSCARFGDGHARCWSDGMTNAAGQPFASLEAPREPITRMSGSFARGCFVLASGGVECHSTDGVVRPEIGARAVTAAAAANSICATTVDGSVVCEPHVRVIEGRARTVVSGTHHFCVLREDDAVYCWDEYRETRPERVALPPANAP